MKIMIWKLTYLFLDISDNRMGFLPQGQCKTFSLGINNLQMAAGKITVTCGHIHVCKMIILSNLLLPGWSKDGENNTACILEPYRENGSYIGSPRYA